MKFKVWDKKKQEFWAETFTPMELAKSHRFPSNAEPYYEIILIAEKIDWRKTYADRFGTIPENIFYWWELTRKLQAAARKDFSDLFIFDCVYHVFENQIVSRAPKNSKDDTEEIPF